MAFEGIDKSFVQSLLQQKSPIDRAYNVERIRILAKRRLPQMVFDFIDGAADDEITMRANQESLARLQLKPRLLSTAGRPDLSVSIFGQELALPVILAPTGMAGLHHADGELAAARAAEAAGTAFTVSTMSSYSVTQVSRQVTTPPWFQLYQAGDRRLAEQVLADAAAAGCTTLVVTIDIPTAGNRERDLKNGFTIPPSITSRNVVDILRDPLRAARWGKHFIQGPGVRLGTLAEATAALGKDSSAFNNVVGQQWSDIEWIREQWNGPMVIKGVMSARDARLAIEHGADGVIVSNHGGRQLDGLPATADVLPEVAEELDGSGAAVLFDGGIRRGSDVIKAIALGADVCLIGRPWAWGLGAAGERGVARVLEILAEDLARTLALLGVSSIAEVDASLLRFTHGAGQEPAAMPLPAAQAPALHH